MDLPREQIPSRIIIMDFTGTGTGKENQARLLDTWQKESIVIDAKITDSRSTDTDVVRSIPTYFAVNEDGNTLLMPTNEFLKHVRTAIEDKWGPSAMSVGANGSSSSSTSHHPSSHKEDELPPRTMPRTGGDGHKFTERELLSLVFELAPEFNPQAPRSMD